MTLYFYITRSKMGEIQSLQSPQQELYDCICLKIPATYFRDFTLAITLHQHYRPNILVPRLEEIIQSRYYNNDSKHETVPVHSCRRHQRSWREKRKNPENAQEAQPNNIDCGTPAAKGPAA